MSAPSFYGAQTIPDPPEHRVRPAPPGADPHAWQRAERARNLLAVIHSLCSGLDVPEVDDEGEPLSAGERVWMVQEMTRESW